MPIMRPISVRGYLVLSIVILLGAFTLRIGALSQTSFDIDEVYTMRSVQKALYEEGFVDGVRYQDAHMPFYFASLLMFPTPPNDFSIRFPSVLWSMLAIAITMRIMTHIYRAPWFALFAGLLLSLHVFNIFSARFARMYEMSHAFVAVSSYLYLRYISNPQNRISNWYGTNLVTMMAYLTHVVTLVLFIGQGIIELRNYLERKTRISHIIIWGILQLVLMLPALVWAVNVFFNYKSTEVWDWIHKPTVNSVLSTLQTLVLGSSTSGTTLVLLPLYIFPFILLCVFFKHIKHAQYWFGLTLIPIVLLIVISQIKSLFVDRYFSVALFAYIIIVALTYKELLEFVVLRGERIATILVYGLIGTQIVVTILFSARMYRIDFFAGNFMKQAIAYINEHGKEGDAVWYDYGSLPQLIEHYLLTDKFNLIDDPLNARDNYLEKGNFSYDRMWILDHRNIWSETDLSNNEPLYDYRGTRVYLMEAE